MTRWLTAERLWVLRCLLLVLVFSVVSCAVGQDAAPAWLPKRLAVADVNAGQIEEALRQVPQRHEAALKFLIRWMPERDLKTLTADFLLENVRLAFAARDAAPWQITDELFFNDVLPYASVSERRDRWRPKFWDRFQDEVANCKSSGEAALRLNQVVFNELEVHYNTSRRRADQSPFESIEQGRATCTGLAIILIDACRAVGVPARFSGVFNWADDRGNHSWVEVWDTSDKSWHFLGADEPDERGLDHAWFVADAARAIPGSREHAIWATSWQATGSTFPLSFAPQVKDVHAVDVTERYLKPDGSDDDACRLFVKLIDVESGERLVRRVNCLEGHVDADSTDVTVLASGETRGQSADLNDFLTFKVVPGSKVSLQVWLDGGIVSRHVTAPSEATHLIEFSTRFDLDPAALARAWYDAAPHHRALVPLDALDDLIRSDEATARQLVWEAFARPESHEVWGKDFAEDRVSAGNVSSPYSVRDVGERPENGWPLVIAMHGGGGTSQEVNDRQWVRMQGYYNDHPEVSGYKYLALRAPNNEWNGFYADYVYPLIDQLITNFAIFGDIDRDRVYLIGYSHGGYGAFAIGPKMPDRFAAIHSSAAAPTDGETSAKTLRTTRFTHMIGENDEDHGRNWRNQRFAEAVSELRGGRDDIYPVELLWKDGYAHSGLPDRDQLTEMMPHLRDPVPTEVYWEQTDGVIDRLFWLADDDPAKGREVMGKCSHNRVELTTSSVGRISLLLDARLVNFDKPIEIVANGRVVTQKRFEPSALTLLESTERSADRGRAATCRIDVPVRDGS